jgi:pimeloyl-ACP methyl ester carboxylesterase
MQPRRSGVDIKDAPMKTPLSHESPHGLQLTAACMLAGSALLGTAVHARDKPSVPVLAWTDCTPPGSQSAPVECATARVPLDYDRPNGEMTEIALARSRATDQANRKGSVFFNLGGPGTPALDAVRNGLTRELSALLKNQFDVIGFDPRGVGESTPLQCWDSNEQRAAFLASVPVFPFSRDQERPFFDKYSNIASLCFGRNQRIIKHMSTADVARDLDLLREAVGDKQLTYLGFSYGSHLGSTYANLFPDKVRALVIDGVVDPRLWSAGLYFPSDNVDAPEVFAEFIRLCDEAAGACALHGPGGALARYEGLRKKLRANPLVLADGTGFGYDTLIAQTNRALYTPETWREFAQALAMLADAADGQAGMADQARAVLRGIDKRIEQARPPRTDYDNSLEAFSSVACSDAAFPRFFEYYSAVGAFAERRSFLSSWWWWPLATPCSAWPAAKDRYAGPWVTRTANPVLVVGNYFDVATGYRGAVDTSRLLRGSRLLSYAGWGHTAFERSACAAAYTAAYLYDGTLPPEGTVCPANPSPWASAEASGALSSKATAPEQKLPVNGLPPPWLQLK